MKLEDVKNKLQDNLTRVEKEEREKRYEHQETIRKRMENIEKLTQTNE